MNLNTYIQNHLDSDQHYAILNIDRADLSVAYIHYSIRLYVVPEEDLVCMRLRDEVQKSWTREELVEYCHERHATEFHRRLENQSWDGEPVVCDPLKDLLSEFGQRIEFSPPPRIP